MISDKYLSATVVYQKKDCGSHLFSYFLHVILSILTSAATDVAATAYRFLSVFFFLLSQFFYFVPLLVLSHRRLMGFAHPEPVKRVSGPPLTPGTS